MAKPKPNPRQQEFWDAEERELWDEIAGTLIEIYMAGGKGGHDVLPSGARVLVNWDRFNENAVQYLRRYRLETVKNISDVTRRHATEIIENWIRNGDPLPVLEQQLESWFSPERAKRIAVTEVTKVYAEANQAAWSSSGIVGANRWNTSNDDRVCPICAPLEGVQSGLDDNGFTTEEGGVGLKSPPAHVNCVIGDTLVLPVGIVAAGTERWYKGDVVTIETFEDKLTVTPNHPILTPSGWIAAGLLKKGDDILCHNFIEWISPSVNTDNQNGISSIENIFSSLSLREFRMPTAAPDFHGDGAGSDIAIVRTNSEIMDILNFHVGENSSKSEFTGRDMISDTTFFPFGSEAKFIEGNNPATGSNMSGRDLAFTLLVGHSLPLDTLRSRLITGSDTSIQQSAANSPAIDSVTLSDAVLALAGKVSIREIINIKRNSFSGHVYNLQTSTGLYVADGIITHNCRCWLTPVVDENLFRDKLREGLYD